MPEVLIKDTKNTDKAINTVRAKFGWIGVSLIVGAYMAFSFLQLKERDATLIEIIGRIALSFIVAFSINRMLDIQGMNVGLSTPSFIEVDKEHLTTTQELGKDRKKLQAYCKYLNNTALIEARSNILSFAGLDYDDFFDKKGKFIGSYLKIEKNADKLDKVILRDKNKRIQESIKHKVTQITPQSLLSDDVKVLDPNYQGQTIGGYTTKSIKLDFIMKIAPAVVFGRIGVEFVALSFASFFLALLELALYIIMGFIKYYNAYTFITMKYKQRIINKTLQLKGLANWVEPIEEEEKNNDNKTGRFIQEPTETIRTVENITTTTSTDNISTGTESIIGTITSEQISDPTE
jgi:hypothetical protein